MKTYFRDFCAFRDKFKDALPPKLPHLQTLLSSISEQFFSNYQLCNGMHQKLHRDVQQWQATEKQDAVS